MLTQISKWSRGAMFLLALAPLLLAQQPAGSIRGVITDKDFEGPLGDATATVVETGQKAKSSAQGNYIILDVKPGRYTVVFSKSGYVRQVRTGVVVSSGRQATVDVALPGEFTDMEPFVVQDSLNLAAGTEEALLQIRFDSPALIDSISADLMNRAGASDAAGALRIVAGTTIKDGKSAVIRGLPDRYVSSQLNGVRLPTSDEDKRAVELDQFPSAIIQDIRVSKTFTPDQQGDASGGAVDVRLRGIPERPFFLQFSSQISYNSQVKDREDFLSYSGGGINFWGNDRGSRDQQLDNLGGNWDGAVGVSTRAAPTDYKWSVAGGGSHEFDNGLKIGAFASLFYERDSNYFDNGRDDSLWVRSPGGPLEPELNQIEGNDQFFTSLFDLEQGTRQVQWGTLGTFGLEWEEQALNFTYLFTRTTEDQATLATDTRGKEFFFPGYDPNDSTSPGSEAPQAAPYLRLETLQYEEREVETIQFNGTHVIPTGKFGIFDSPKIDWNVAFSEASLYQPDKRQFASFWQNEQVLVPPSPGFPGIIIPASWQQFKPDALFTLGNLQRIWKTIEEESDQYAVNLELPFEQWDGEKGYFKFGWFSDSVKRTFDQDTFSNFNDPSFFEADFDTPWSPAFPSQDHPISDGPPFVDVDYDGELNVDALYAMLKLPLTKSLTLIGGARFESTEISIVNDPEPDATWFPPGSITGAPVALGPGDADVAFDQNNVLPSVSMIWDPLDELTLRGAWSKTIARQTFKELTPIFQQEFLGGPVFIGNPNLQISEVMNYDLRADWTPIAGGLISASFFYKDIEDAIEYVQRVDPFTYTTPRNYPEGEILGFEFEIRQDMGEVWEPLTGLTLGFNATFIDSEVTLPQDEQDDFQDPNIAVNIKTREMAFAPENLFNLFLTYDIPDWGTNIGIFYTITGDTLLVGAGEALNNFVPSIYAKSFDTLNVTVSQRIGDHFTLRAQAKNLTNPDIEQYYGGPGVSGETTRASFSSGVDWSISLSANFTF